MVSSRHKMVSGLCRTYHPVWLPACHGPDNYTHCEDICDIMKAYDVGYSLGAGQALGQVRDNALSKRELPCFLDCLPHNKSHHSG